MIGDVFVYLREGTYELKEPLVFQAQDSGHNGYSVMYMAYPGDTPVLPIGLTPNDPMGSVARWAGPIFPSP